MTTTPAKYHEPEPSASHAERLALLAGCLTLSLQEAAMHLGLHRGTVKRLCAEGKLPGAYKRRRLLSRPAPGYRPWVCSPWRIPYAALTAYNAARAEEAVRKERAARARRAARLAAEAAAPGSGAAIEGPRARGVRRVGRGRPAGALTGEGGSGEAPRGAVGRDE